MLERVFRRDFPRLVRLNARYLIFILFAAEWLKDVRLGIQTGTGLRGSLSLDGLSLVGDATSANPYATTPYGTLQRLFDALPSDLSDYSFIDFGSGKGRVLARGGARPAARGMVISSNICKLLSRLRNCGMFRNCRRGR